MTGTALAYKLAVFRDVEIYHARSSQVSAILQVMIEDALRFG